MDRLRIAVLLVAVGMLILPPRWCCAIPGIQAECCNACAAEAEAGNSCCGCSTESEAPHKPCKCVCHDELAQLDKQFDYTPAVLSLPLPPPLAATLFAPCYVAFQLLPPHDFQSRLCRWLI